uniref:SAP domain-containing protein n=1 Tax=Minutocellus polymorphus TaxID=265543 RepID=A0A7S0AMW8_9STRA|mmetsp:Transcript_17514/g.29165  ORF Transcript_17514/g.29165 Transcript_17514/m.29165 type:complete len:442 (+) Transcript_17514:32-1357(+)
MKVNGAVLKLILAAATVSDATAFSPSSMSPINEAVAQASDAARLAAEAASSIAPSTSTSLVTATADEKSLTLYEYVLSGGSSGGEVDAVSRIANAQDKFQVMRDNLDTLLKDMNIPDTGSIGANLGDITTGFSGSLDGGVDVGSMKNQIGSIVSSLALEQNAAWYAVGAAVLVALGQRGAGRADAKSEFEVELTNARKKADEAAGAATLAAKGAAMAKEAATQVEAKATSDGAGTNALLENSRLRQLAVETEMANQELKKLKAENERLKTQLVGLQGGEKLKDDVSEEGSPAPSSTQEVVDRDPEENEKILEIIKEVEEANMKGKKKVPQEKKAAPPSSKKAAAPRKVTKATAKKASTPKAAAKTTPKAAAKKAPAPKKKKSPAAKNDASGKKDWSQLSDSTLKRKTIAQLKEYLLEQKLANSTDVSNMKKGDLITMVKKG